MPCRRSAPASGSGCSKKLLGWPRDPSVAPARQPDKSIPETSRAVADFRTCESMPGKDVQGGGPRYGLPSVANAELLVDMLHV